MPKLSLLLGTLGLLSIALTIFAQDLEDPAPIPKPIPIEENEEAPVVEEDEEAPVVEEQEVNEFEDNPEPINLDDIDEKDIPKALPVVRDIPKAKPVAAAELERLRIEREEKRIAEEEEMQQAKREREEQEAAALAKAEEEAEAEAEALAAAEAEKAAVVPRAIPIGGDTEVVSNTKPRRDGLSPMDVSSHKSPDLGIREQEKATSKLNTTWNTRTDARSLSLVIPAPRGQIVDRWGQPLAQNKVSNVLALKFHQKEGTDERDVLDYAHRRIDRANRMLGRSWELSDAAILKHFANRRWLPLILSTPLTEWQEDTIKPKLDEGLVFFPTYTRHYPERKLAAHILGSIKKVRRMPTGPVSSGQELFPELIGREGLEASFDADLQGTHGQVNYLFDSDGTELDREIASQPIPGSTVVTTLDLEMQELAEQILKNSVKRGAFVVMDVNTGEVLTMASYPSFDPNEFSPSISSTRFNELLNDPERPLVARAFRGSYPPASTFKIITALAALESGAITGTTKFPCPPMMMIDNRPFRNWNKKREDDMDVVVAIARSCNPFFYKAGLRTGAQNLSSMGNRFGFGQKTGIKIAGEEDGYMPSDASEREKYNHSFAGGYLANASIGQGSVAATPLQVCQMMAGVANGRAVPQARLVKQVQTYDNKVTKYFEPEDKFVLNLQKSSLDTVRRGMVKVVNASWGTGKSASNYYVTLAGKTGTGQWGPTADKRYLAWFAGFVPAENPQYAFAVLYEGDKGEKIGGGRIAAPLAGRFFNAVYRKKKEGGQLAGYKRASSSNSSSGRSTPPAAALRIRRKRQPLRSLRKPSLPQNPRRLRRNAAASSTASAAAASRWRSRSPPSAIPPQTTTGSCASSAPSTPFSRPACRSSTRTAR